MKVQPLRSEFTDAAANAARASDDVGAEPALELTAVAAPFVESSIEDEIPSEILNRRICDFDLRIEGRPLEQIIERFRAEMRERGITALEPRFYLTDEWGVPEGTVAIGIPFYLADAELLRVHGLKGGLVEGQDEEDILRYLRHELGHVVNYAYRLYTSEEWTRLFGPMSRPYPQEYRALPFSTSFVRHLPGGYAQTHPDEDWAETFAVWMTPQSAWRELYADSPAALAKLEYCDRMLAALKDKSPDVTSTAIDYEANEINATVQEFYESFEVGDVRIPRSLDGDLRLIFALRTDSAAPTATAQDAPRTGDAALLLRRQRDALVGVAYRWTGLTPELLWKLIDHLIDRAAELKLTYALSERDAILVELAGFIHTLAMNYIYRGSFIGN